MKMQESLGKKPGRHLCIVQARMGSTRLAGKVMLRVKGVPLLEYEIRRLRQSKKIDKIVVATTMARVDDAVVRLCKKIGVDCFRGSEKDVLERYYQCSLRYPRYSRIVRITGDCPLIDPAVVDEVIDFFHVGRFDYASNVLKETFPDGMDVEVFTRKALLEAAENARLRSEREHVTLYIRNQRRFKKGNVAAPHDFSHIRLTVDEPEDFEVVSFLIGHAPPDADYLDYIALLTKHPNVMTKNMYIKRNEGWAKSLREDTNISERNVRGRP